MKQIYILSFGKIAGCSLFFFLFSFKLFATGPTPVSGNVSGIWDTAHSPYVITGNVTVPTGLTLIIQPGVEVQFTNGNNTISQFFVAGVLKAKGTVQDSIKFTGGGFSYSSQRGPVIIESTSNNDTLQYVSINGLGYNSHDDRSAAVIIYSNCKILNCSFQNIAGTAIKVLSGIPEISGNYFNINTVSNYDVLLDLDKVRTLVNNNPIRVGLTAVAPVALNNTLAADKLYYSLLDNQTIPQTKTLVIDPGATVQFTNGNAAVSQLIIQGTLKAQGSESNYINFTGGGFSYASQRGPITFESVSFNSVLQYVNISQLGYYSNSDYTPAIVVNATSCRISNCNIQVINGTAIQVGNARPVISNNIIANNSNMDVIMDLDKLTTLSGNNTTTDGLKIGLTHGAEMGSNDVLFAEHVQFYRMLVNQTVPESKTLTINPGVTVQFTNGNSTLSQLIVQGTLTAIGDASNYINFTGGGFSYASQRGPITIDATSNNSVMQFVTISQLGYYSNNSTTTAVLIVKSSSFQLKNCSFLSNNGIAVSIQNSSSPTISRTCFFTNAAAILADGGKAKISECNFVSNTSFGIKNTGITDTIDATNCFWGDASGPREPVANPGGSGDIISGKVLYNPFIADQFDCSTLPVTLSNFQVNLNGSIVNCNWETSTEINTNYFIVERSINGTNFSGIAQIAAAGNSDATKSYRFSDKMPNGGINYYRLKMVDKDGRYAYSKVVPINIRLKGVFNIYPNPVGNNLSLQVKRDKPEKAVIQITDMQGKILHEEGVQLQPGTTALNFNTSVLSKGMYIVIIKGQETAIKTFVKD